MQLRLSEKRSFEKLTGDIPELYVVLADPDDEGENVTSANGEIRLWIEPYTYSSDGASRTYTLVVKVGTPLIRNSGKEAGALDYVDRVITLLDGFEHTTGLTWSPLSARFDKKVGTINWYIVRFSRTETLP